VLPSGRLLPEQGNERLAIAYSAVPVSQRRRKTPQVPARSQLVTMILPSSTELVWSLDEKRAEKVSTSY
jgi:hypothetical protein